MSDERTFYDPKYFERVEIDGVDGNSYDYRPRKDQEGNYLYWSLREKGDWTGAPKIYEDKCEPFY